MSTRDHSTLLSDLTEPQARAVMHTEGPLLVLAAAGSGKTRVITRRIARLIDDGVAPWRILALTFTNRAAGEMRERVEHVMGGPMRGLVITTFHSLCARLMRRYAHAAGLPQDFTIYDSGDQVDLMKGVLEANNLSSSNFPPRSVLGAISNAKNELLDADAYEQDAFDFYSKSIAKLYHGYQRALLAAKAVDFDDLLMYTASTLKSSTIVRDECRARWNFLLVDEYQDTNRAQFAIASLLAGDGANGSLGPNICVVGDPDQAIYGWRGADITNILEFEKHYPKAKVIALGENFRSDAPILSVADTLIRNNEQRKHKDLFTSRAGGEPVDITLLRTEQSESLHVVDWLRTQHDPKGFGPTLAEGVPWREMAVFYRTNALSRVMEDALRGAGIPYNIARGTAFFDREEVRNAIAYLRVISNPADAVSLNRIVNVPTRGLGSTSLSRLDVLAADGKTTLFNAMRAVTASTPGFNARSANAARGFTELIDGWTDSGAFMGGQVASSLSALVERVITESGLRAMYKRQAELSRSETDLERVANLDEVVSSARQFELEYDPANDAAMEAPIGDIEIPPLLAMLRAYLESVSLVADADSVDPAQGAVTLMTLHAAKGLEFTAVAMIGLEEGLMPHSRALANPSELEEERRLCFVGITRAMKRLSMTCAMYRTVRGITERTIPSRFLKELGSQHVLVLDRSDPFSDGNTERWASAGDRMREDRRVEPAYESMTRRDYEAPFPVGSHVRHPQFGMGEVLSINGGPNARAKIRFYDVGVKTLVLEHARLQKA